MSQLHQSGSVDLLETSGTVSVEAAMKQFVTPYSHEDII